MNLRVAARKRRISTRKVTTRASLCSLALAVLCAAGPALAVEPAGGPPYPPGTAPQEEVALGPDAPDASVDERGWLAPTSTGDDALTTSSAPGSSVLTLLALLLVAGL